jgi:hypothetical protein
MHRLNPIRRAFSSCVIALLMARVLVGAAERPAEEGAHEFDLVVMQATPGGLDESKMMLHAETWPGQVPYRALLPPSPQTARLTSNAVITREEAVRLMWERLAEP